jgi:hypothetical protein
MRDGASVVEHMHAIIADRFSPNGIEHNIAIFNVGLQAEVMAKFRKGALVLGKRRWRR